MKVPDAQLPAEKVMIDRFYTHVPSKVVCRSVVEVKAVIKIMEVRARRGWGGARMRRGVR
jgi:hypothetical protein